MGTTHKSAVHTSAIHRNTTIQRSLGRVVALAALAAVAIVYFAVPSASQTAQLDGRNEVLPGGNVSIVVTGCPVAPDHQLTVVQITPSEIQIEHLGAPMGDTYQFAVQSRFDTEPGEHHFVPYCQTLVGTQWSAITLYDTVSVTMLAEDPNVPPQTTKITGEFDTRTLDAPSSDAEPGDSSTISVSPTNGGGAGPTVSFTG